MAIPGLLGRRIELSMTPRFSVGTDIPRRMYARIPRMAHFPQQPDA